MRPRRDHSVSRSWTRRCDCPGGWDGAGHHGTDGHSSDLSDNAEVASSILASPTPQPHPTAPPLIWPGRSPGSTVPRARRRNSGSIPRFSREAAVLAVVFVATAFRARLLSHPTGSDGVSQWSSNPKMKSNIRSEELNPAVGKLIYSAITSLDGYERIWTAILIRQHQRRGVRLRQ